MMQRKQFFAFALLGLALKCQGVDEQENLKSYDHFKVVKIQTSNEDIVHDLVETFNGLELWLVNLIEGIINVLVPPSLYPTLTSWLGQSNLTFSTIIEDIGKLINPTNKDDDYYTPLNEIYNNLTMFEKRYAFVSIDEIGLTFENRSMKVLKVCFVFRNQS